MSSFVCRISLVLAWCALSASAGPMGATWDRYDEIPGAQAVQKAQAQNGRLVTTPRVRDVRYTDDGTAVWVQDRSGWRAFLLASGNELDVEDQQPPARAQSTQPRRRGGGGGRVARGRQAKKTTSPDKKWTAIHSDFNVLLRGEDNSERAVTTEGTARQRFGTASWVYGEELDQQSAMWFSPDSKLLAFYAFDVTDVPDYFLLSGLTDLRTTVMDEAYPKPGDANPIAGIQIYDIESGETTTVDVGDNDDQYIYRISFTPDSRYLLFHRMNRLQNELEIVRVDPATGEGTVLFTETQPTWVEQAPEMRWLDDDRKFLIVSERTGFKTWELWDVDAGKLAVLGPGTFSAESILRVDEDDSAPGGGTLYFTGYSDDHPMNLQLHEVHFDGSNFRRLTGESLNHSSFKLAPDGSSVVATATDAATPPRVLLYGADGKTIATIAESDTSRLDDSDALPSELFSFEAADGQTCYGRVHYPSDFDPSRKWPALVQVYGGPESRALRNTFQVSSGLTEFGFVVVEIDNRGTGGRGKAFEGATYLKLGQVDLDDQARGMQVLAERNDWLDTDRVGITGHSYGGYMSALAVLRHPEVFSVAVAGAPVTDWRNYDTIYTERYMRTPAENGENYDAGSCVELAGNLEGKLLLLHGMVDDNVHPTNGWQLVDALQSRNIPFEMQFFPNSAHGIYSPASRSAKWSFLVKHLVGPE